MADSDPYANAPKFPLNARCPHCGADVGKPCKTRVGRRAKPHDIRRSPYAQSFPSTVEPRS